MKEQRFLNQKMAIQLAREIEKYINEKNEPFKDYQSAVEWLSKHLGWSPRPAHIKTACSNIEVQTSKFVRSTNGNAIGGMISSISRRMEVLESRIEKLEQEWK